VVTCELVGRELFASLGIILLGRGYLSRLNYTFWLNFDLVNRKLASRKEERVSGLTSQVTRKQQLGILRSQVIQLALMYT
jgi:hypothetical protein